jgi:hypothetical protein
MPAPVHGRRAWAGRARDDNLFELLCPVAQENAARLERSVSLRLYRELLQNDCRDPGESYGLVHPHDGCCASGKVAQWGEMI